MSTAVQSKRVLLAQPGFFLLMVIRDDAGSPVGVDKHAVLGWALDGELLIPAPITLCGVQVEGAYVLQPDGSVERANNDWFSSEAAWFSDQMREYFTAHVGKR